MLLKLQFLLYPKLNSEKQNASKQVRWRILTVQKRIDAKLVFTFVVVYIPIVIDYTVKNPSFR